MPRSFVKLFAGALLLSAPAPGAIVFIEINEAGGSSFVVPGVATGRLTNNVKNGEPSTRDPSPNPPFPHLFHDPFVLTFTNLAMLLPANQGDVVLGPPGADEDKSNGDLIRFFGNKIVFYSAALFPEGNFDIGVPDAHAGFQLLPEEDFGDCHDGAHYVPVRGEPGYFDVPLPGAPAGVTFHPDYTFVSDAPEPATWIFTAMGLVSLLARRRKRPYPL